MRAEKTELGRFQGKKQITVKPGNFQKLALHLRKKKIMAAKKFFEESFLKYFKIFLGVVCAIGFLSQTIIFLKFYYSPPSFLDLKIKQPEKFVFPALTFCNANLVKRSKFCTDYSDKCGAPPNMQAFCDRYPQYCFKNDDPLKDNIEWQYDQNFQVPQNKVFWPRDLVPTEDLPSFTQNVSTIIFTSVEKSDSAGPYFYEKPERSLLIPCYTQHSRVDSELEPFMSFFAPFEKASRQVSNYPTLVRSLSLKVEPTEYMDVKMKPGAYFTLHSPYEAVNPHYKGVFMETGKTYHIYLQLEEDHIIPSPESDCVDYIKRWKINGNKGTRSKKMCLEKCHLNFDLACNGCVNRANTYPTQHQKCMFNNMSYSGCNTEVALDEFRRCVSACPKECSKLKYSYTVEERPQIEKLFYDERWKLIYINIYLDDPYITVRSHKLPLEFVDSCSYIGGFLSFWICIYLLFAFIAQLLHPYIVSCFKEKQSTVSG